MERLADSLMWLDEFQSVAGEDPENEYCDLVEEFGSYLPIFQWEAV